MYVILDSYMQLLAGIYILYLTSVYFLSPFSTLFMNFSKSIHAMGRAERCLLLRKHKNSVYVPAKNSISSYPYPFLMFLGCKIFSSLWTTTICN